jgi:hypothetical protein
MELVNFIELASLIVVIFIVGCQAECLARSYNTLHFLHDHDVLPREKEEGNTLIWIRAHTYNSKSNNFVVLVLKRTCYSSIASLLVTTIQRQMGGYIRLYTKMLGTSVYKTN